MPKAYWIAHVDVHDNEIYAKYKEANACLLYTSPSPRD